MKQRILKLLKKNGESEGFANVIIIVIGCIIYFAGSLGVSFIAYKVVYEILCNCGMPTDNSMWISTSIGVIVFCAIPYLTKK